MLKLALEEIDDLRCEFMQDHGKTKICLYDFEDIGYIDDVKEILFRYNIRFTAKSSEVWIYKE